MTAKVRKPYDYIRHTYSFDPVIDRRVRHTITGREGVIAPEEPGAGHYVQVRFGDDTWALPCHPMELVYVDQPATPAMED